MAKLIINDKDYYTDDFNEEQVTMHQEIILAQSEIGRMDYLTKVLQARCSMLGGMIVEIADQEETDETETSA
jgi:hypothetical protein